MGVHKGKHIPFAWQRRPPLPLCPWVRPRRPFPHSAQNPVNFPLKLFAPFLQHFRNHPIRPGLPVVWPAPETLVDLERPKGLIESARPPQWARRHCPRFATGPARRTTTLIRSGRPLPRNRPSPLRHLQLPESPTKLPFNPKAGRRGGMVSHVAPIRACPRQLFPPTLTPGGSHVREGPWGVLYGGRPSSLETRRNCVAQPMPIVLMSPHPWQWVKFSPPPHYFHPRPKGCNSHALPRGLGRLRCEEIAQARRILMAHIRCLRGVSHESSILRNRLGCILRGPGASAPRPHSENALRTRIVHERRASTHL